jgi:hypothetical protein
LKDTSFGGVEEIEERNCVDSFSISLLMIYFDLEANQEVRCYAVINLEVILGEPVSS